MAQASGAVVDDLVISIVNRSWTCNGRPFGRNPYDITSIWYSMTPEALTAVKPKYDANVNWREIEIFEKTRKEARDFLVRARMIAGHGYGARMSALHDCDCYPG